MPSDNHQTLLAIAIGAAAASSSVRDASDAISMGKYAQELAAMQKGDLEPLRSLVERLGVEVVKERGIVLSIIDHLKLHAEYTAKRRDLGCVSLATTASQMREWLRRARSG